ncbi:NAD-dependent malic enzyme [Nibricoccus sp. IMCC34717]|uniref:NAD-dependent malic enzyme n=1 Tax=Nibricoccus sp. IMCC34717 TaxID=3034021 RepID=UPI0038503921
MQDTPVKPIDSRGGGFQLRGSALLTNSLLNKGTAFSEFERDALGLRGLLPPRVFPLDVQLKRVLGNLRRKTDPLEKYIFLTTLQNRNETLFYRLLVDHLEEVMPLIYTPTVGQACLEYGSIFRRPRGLFLTIEDKGRIREILRHWPNFAKLIVVTDGERILGLGDLGALGMGIPVGKLSLYSACAGVHPYYCLPICIDVGTENETLLQDPMYVGLPRKRVRGPEYEAFMEEFVQAVQDVFPGALLQFEDFGNHNAFQLLKTYRERVCCFNDDIQGTASVALAGLIAATRALGKKLSDHKILFLGAGEAGTGIADLFVEAAKKEGMDEAAARKLCWFVDSKGLLVKDRGDKLPHHKVPYAHESQFVKTLAEAVDLLKPTALIGVAGTGRAFDEKMLRTMATLNERPIIFALSNPTSKAECTAEEAYRWTDGRAIFASGSPFAPVELNGQRFEPGQGNNVYIFPGVGLGALVAQARVVTDEMFLAAAYTVADLVGPEDLAVGRIYPGLTRIRDVSAKIATAVANLAWRDGTAQRAKPDDVEADVRSRMFEPVYHPYV